MIFYRFTLTSWTPIARDPNLPGGDVVVSLPSQTRVSSTSGDRWKKTWKTRLSFLRCILDARRIDRKGRGRDPTRPTETSRFQLFTDQFGVNCFNVPTPFRFWFYTRSFTEFLNFILIEINVSSFIDKIWFFIYPWCFYCVDLHSLVVLLVLEPVPNTANSA